MLMAVLCDIHHHCLFPAEEEVSGACSSGHGDAQVPVVGHEDEHEEVADHHLDDVQHSLQQVGQAQHLLAHGFVCLHQDGAIGARHWHGVIADADLGFPEQTLPGNLKAFIKHGQEENSHKSTSHFSRRIDCKSREQQWHILIAEVESHGHHHHHVVTVSRGRGGVVMLRRMRRWHHGAVHVVRHLEDTKIQKGT